MLARLTSVDLPPHSPSSKKSVIQYNLKSIDCGMGLAISDILMTLEGIAFSAYSQPHPAEDCHFIRVFAENTRITLDDAMSLWRSALRELLVSLEQLQPYTRSTRTNAWSRTITIKNSATSFANMVRRLLLSQINTLSISKVTFIENTSILCDELIVQRLSQLPIRLSSGIPREEDCVEFTLSVQFPSLESQEGPKSSQYWVKHDSLKVKTKNGNVACLKSVRKTLIPDYDMLYPIVPLNPGEQVVLTACTCIGDGDKHSRFSAVGPLVFAHGASATSIHIESNGQLQTDEIVSCLIVCVKSHVDSLFRVRGEDEAGRV